MISVSDLSHLGVCQIAFFLNKRAKIVTYAMKQGAKRHNDLFQAIEPLTQGQMLEKIASGESFVAREVRVEYPEGGLKGRIDELEFLGHNRDRRNEVIIRDDKFSSSKFLGMTDAHRLQLASYAFVTPEDDKFRDLVEIAGASIKFRSFDNAEPIEFKVGCEQLLSWVRTVPLLVGIADSILANEYVPKPIGFSSIDASWLSVPKATCASCKYNNICNQGRKNLLEQMAGLHKNLI